MFYDNLWNPLPGGSRHRSWHVRQPGLGQSIHFGLGRCFTLPRHCSPYPSVSIHPGLGSVCVFLLRRLIFCGCGSESPMDGKSHGERLWGNCLTRTCSLNMLTSVCWSTDPSPNKPSEEGKQTASLPVSTHFRAAARCHTLVLKHEAGGCFILIFKSSPPESMSVRSRQCAFSLLKFCV